MTDGAWLPVFDVFLSEENRAPRILCSGMARFRAACAVRWNREALADRVGERNSLTAVNPQRAKTTREHCAGRIFARGVAVP